MNIIISIDIGVLHLAIIKIGFWDHATISNKYEYKILKVGLFDIKNEVISRQKQHKQWCQFQHQASLLQQYLHPFCESEPDDNISAIVIEQQFGFGGNANNIMKCMSHRIHQYFVDEFYRPCPNSSLGRHTPRICFMSARSKFKICQLPASILQQGGIDAEQLKTKPLRKKYSVFIAEQYIAEDVSCKQWSADQRQYFMDLKHSTNKSKDKRDDIADVFIQALAFYERHNKKIK